MPPITIQQVFTIALPFIAMLTSYGIQQAHFKPAANTWIASGTVIGAALADAFIQGKLTGNFYTDLLVIAGSATALQADAFAPLQQYLRNNFLATSKPPAQSQPPVVPSKGIGNGD